MNAESFMKSIVACNLVSLMLQEDGYTVIPLRNNEILDRLIQLGANSTKVTKLLLNMPSFIVVDKKKEVKLITVKYSGNGKSGRNIDWGHKQIDQYWSGTLMIIVTNEEPYFLIKKETEIVSLVQSGLKINKKTSDKYAQLVKKFLD